LGFNPGVPGKPKWGGRDHWHEVKGGKKTKKRLPPGEEIPVPGDQPEPNPGDNGPSNWDPGTANKIAVGVGTAVVVIGILILTDGAAAHVLLAAGA
jgi:hypothetical protein